MSRTVGRANSGSQVSVKTPFHEEIDTAVDDFFTSVEEDRARLGKYYQRLKKRTEEFYGQLEYTMGVMQSGIQKTLEANGVFQEIQHMVERDAKAKGWDPQEIEKQVKASKGVLSHAFGNEILSSVTFLAASKAIHHKDVGYVRFLSSFFDKISDKTVREKAIESAKKHMVKDGYPADHVDDIFREMPALKMEFRRNSKSRNIEGLNIKLASDYSKVWTVMKDAQRKRLDDIVQNAGLPATRVTEILGSIANAVRGLDGLTDPVKNRTFGELRKLGGRFQSGVAAAGKVVGVDLAKDELFINQVEAPATVAGNTAAPAKTPSFDEADIPDKAADEHVMGSRGMAP
jgi:hypothetical protein